MHPRSTPWNKVEPTSGSCKTTLNPEPRAWEEKAYLTRVLRKLLAALALTAVVVVFQTSRPAAQDDGAEEAERLTRAAAVLDASIGADDSICMSIGRALDDAAIRAHVMLSDPDGTPGSGDEVFETTVAGGTVLDLGTGRIRKAGLDAILRTTLVVSF